MHVDYLSLACLRDCLDTLLGARVQRVLLPDDLSVGLELYAGQRFQLLMSAHAQHARMLFMPQKLRRGVETETPLLQLLRKWVRGARLMDVAQPEWERVLVLHFAGRAGPCRLVVELIGRYSNLILVGPDGRVLDAVKRIGPDLNRYRVILPARPYQPPPVPLGRSAPTEVTASEWASHVGGAGVCKPSDPLYRLLTGRLLGVSPMVAREIAFRAMGDVEIEVRNLDPSPLTAAIRELFAPVYGDGRWSPHVALDEAGGVVAFAPYEPRQFERIEPAPSISDGMHRYFEQQLTGDSYAAARNRVQELLDQAGARIERAMVQLQAQVMSDGEVDRLREAGELLLAYQGQVARGASAITVPDHAGDPRIIALDPTLTPVENAQAYFRRYRKSSRAAEEVAGRIQALKPDLAYVEQLMADLALAESRPEIDAVQDGLVEAGLAPKTRRSGGSKLAGGPRQFDIDGFVVYVGRNARQNEEVTFKRAAPDDLWLHVRGQPGAHVVVKSGGQAVPEEVVRRAAELAAHYSPARDSGKVDVDVTERRFVRRVRGGHPGLVTYRNERTKLVEVESPLD
jgi:predicted ribosome quality control (RQC) complex YloA/Tae2 family protein